jgi:hypothetical protein
VILTSHALRNYSKVLHERDPTSLSLLFIASSTRHHTESTPQRCDSRYDEPGNVIETHDHAGDFKEPSSSVCPREAIDFFCDMHSPAMPVMKQKNDGSKSRDGHLTGREGAGITP